MALLVIDKLTDSQLRDLLIRLDCNDEVDVLSNEADWLERTIYRHQGTFTVQQRAEAGRLLKKYRRWL